MKDFFLFSGIVLISIGFMFMPGNASPKAGTSIFYNLANMGIFCHTGFIWMVAGLSIVLISIFLKRK